MAATRYLLEGERLDILLAQVRTMGKRVRVLKAERVHSGGVAGFFSKEHYELMVEVDSGDVPDNFRRVPEPAVQQLPSGQPSRKPRQSSGSVTGSASGAVALEQDLDRLISSARAQISSGMDAADARLDAALEELAAATAASRSNLTNPDGMDLGAVMPPPWEPGRNGSTTDTSGRGREASLAALAGGAGGVSGDVGNLRGAATVAAGAGLGAAQGALAQAGGDPNVGPGSVGAGGMAEARGKQLLLTDEMLFSLGFPQKYIDQLPQSPIGLPLERVLRDIPPPPPLQIDPGSTIVVIGAAPQSMQAIEVGQRLAARIGPQAYVVLGGAKTVLQGDGVRVRTAEELNGQHIANEGGVCVLVLVDSMVETHRRTTIKLVTAALPDQVWAVVDSRAAKPRVKSWLRSLPGDLQADALAMYRVWEAPEPASGLALDVPIAMLDAVPASPQAWQLLFNERLEQL